MKRRFGGLFNLIGNNTGYIDIPPVVASAAGVVIISLVKAYLEKIISIYCLIVLAVLVLIPSIILFIRDKKM